MSAYGGQGSIATTHTADTAALAAKGRFLGLLCAPTGAVTPTITVYDNASAASGTKLATIKLQSAAPFFFSFGDEGISALSGVFVAADSWTTLTVTSYTKA